MEGNLLRNILLHRPSGSRIDHQVWTLSTVLQPAINTVNERGPNTSMKRDL